MGKDQKPPRFGISVFMLDAKGKVLVHASGGNDSFSEISKVSNFIQLISHFKKLIEAYYKSDSLTERKKKWTDEDQKVADARKKKLEKLVKKEANR